MLSSLQSPHWYVNKPAYDIKCLNDNIMEKFVSQQPLFSNKNTALAVQILMLGSVAIAIGGAVVHWLLYADNLKFPIAIFLFYVVKLFSDTSLTLSKPSNTMWQDMNILGFNISDVNLFHANVDTACGLVLLSMLYFLSLRKLIRAKNNIQRGYRFLLWDLLVHHFLRTHDAADLHI